VYNDYMFPQIWAFHEANPFLQYPQFLVFITESNDSDFKNEWEEDKDKAPCPEE